MILVAVTTLLSLAFIPWNFLLLCIILLAATGRSLGVRQFFIKTLLDVFEYGRESIENANRQKYSNLDDKSEDEGFGEEEEIKNDTQLISREKHLILLPELPSSSLLNDVDHKEGKINFDMKHWLKGLELIKSGIEAIIEDQVTRRFEAVELKNWNFLTRTDQSYEFISWKLTFLWLFGFFVRYVLLLPIRLYIFSFGITWLAVSTAIVGQLPKSTFKSWLNERCYIIAFRILTRSISAVITFHNKQWRPQKGSICVANHTSPIDCVILSNDNCYSLIGQKHGGLLGIIQRALNRASPHIWFERSEVRDRSLVSQRLKDHTANKTNPPMLIFPEGTCINNTSVMQFKKGSFEVGCPIYPVAIKYDAKFGDPFWNSSKYSMVQYLGMMMTSWAIVCEVWYLPPVHQKLDESSIQYANRVKRLIAEQGGLVDLVWDGGLKRSKPKKEWRENQQEKLSKIWKEN